MKNLLTTISLLLWAPLSFGDTVNRLEGEAPEQFAKRHSPSQAEVAHSVIETEVWDSKKVVIAFYDTEFKQAGPGYRQVIGYVYLPESENKYQKILIDNFEPEGGNPKIESVFFANADKDETKELIVICSWPQRHADVSGTLYGTFVFHAPQPNTKQEKLTFLEGVSKQLDGGCECERSDGKKEKAKYKTAAETRAALKKLGF